MIINSCLHDKGKKWWEKSVLVAKDIALFQFCFSYEQIVESLIGKSEIPHIHV